MPVATPRSYRCAPPIVGLLLAVGLLACQTVTPAPRPTLEEPLPALTSDFSAPGASLGALRIQSPDQLIGGPSATGEVGDYLLYNDKIKVVISDISHPGDQAQSGGNIIDADLARGGHDELAEAFTYLDNTFPRQLVYETIAVTKGGSDGAQAQISVVGRDNMNPQIYGVTHYSIEPFTAQVKIVTEIVNTSLEAIPEYDLGDAIQWGRDQAFAPGYGTELAGQTTQGPWVAGLGREVSYGWTSMGVTLRGPHGNSWSDVIIGKVDLPPQGRATYERFLTLGSGDVASMLPAIFKIRGELSEELAGSVVEKDSGFSIEGATVEASFIRTGRPYAQATSDSRGVFSMILPPDEYVLSVRHPSRESYGEPRVDLIHGTPSPQRLVMSAPGILRFNVVGDGGQGIPAKVSIVGTGKSATPDLGPKFATTTGAMGYVFTPTGQGEIAIPPGTYTVTVSRGIEYSLHQEDITLAPGESVSIEAALKREVNTGGYLSADLHQASRHSSDSAVALKDVLIANLAEGVEVMVGADEQYIPDYAPVLSALGANDELKVIPGAVLKAPGVGAFSVFPISPNPGAPGNGAPWAPGDASPQDVLAALNGPEGTPLRVVQVNHPREGAPLGYFDNVALDPSTGLVHDDKMSFAFNTIEVFNGKRLKAASAVLRDYFLLLNQGYTFTATGSSDSHTTVTQERGYPRTYVGVGEDAPSLLEETQLTQALVLGRNAVVTNGPFIRLKANDVAEIGQLLKAEGGQVALDIQVSAPQWVHVDRVEIVANGEVIRTLEATNPDGVVKLTTREAFALPRDTWFVVVARGSKGMDPVIPQYKGTTITPLGFTNPIWIDVDGDDSFTPLFPPGSTPRDYSPTQLLRADTP